MTDTAAQAERGFPVFELGYSDNLTGRPDYVRSSQGTIFLRLAGGSAFTAINLRIVSSAIPLRLTYKCLYKPVGTNTDVLAESPEGHRCPLGDSRYIKQFAIESKIYYRCWLSRDRHPDEYERNPAGTFWCYNGCFCGTTEDNRWITALEIKMPPLVDGWRSAQAAFSR